MSVSIFYKTYSKDIEWLKYSLKSLEKYVKGYNDIHILIPLYEKEIFQNLELLPNTVVHYVNDYGDKYLFQQVCKIQAHKYCDSEFIFFADSDCIFDHDINVQDFVADNKPEILYTHYSKVGDAVCWKKPTETFIKAPVDYEYMRRNCLIYHRSTLVDIEKYEPNLEYIIMKSERFSEYNAIGVYAWTYERDKYNFVDTDNWTYTQPKAIQYHSYTEWDKMRNEFKDL